MIKFCGHISENNKNFIIKKEKLLFFLAALIPVIIGMILTIVAAIKINLIWLIFFIPLLFFLSTPLFPLSKKTIELMIPSKITITKTIITSEGTSFKTTKNLSDVKKVIDYGNFYQVCFKWPKKSYKFLCQKDLITEGTIEDFEKMFSSKIVKK